MPQSITNAVLMFNIGGSIFCGFATIGVLSAITGLVSEFNASVIGLFFMAIVNFMIARGVKRKSKIALNFGILEFLLIVAFHADDLLQLKFSGSLYFLFGALAAAWLWSIKPDLEGHRA